jgi:N-acetylglutamate synthase/N-acetylornithine aminotransferase
MQDTITTMFCLCDDFLKANGCRDDKQCRLSTAEVMTVPLVACAFFGGNYALARRFLVAHGYFKQDLSASECFTLLSALACHR